MRVVEVLCGNFDGIFVWRLYFEDKYGCGIDWWIGWLKGNEVDVKVGWRRRGRRKS